MPKMIGRPNGHLLHREGFEAICTARNIFKKDVAIAAELSPSFLTDLLYHRAGASPAAAERLASTLGVVPAAIFPSYAGWVGPIPNRKNTKVAA